jgi:predicted transcriptional regulator
MSETVHKREQGPSISVPVDSEMLARVRSAAEREHRSVANFARLALARALDQQQRDGAMA